VPRPNLNPGRRHRAADDRKELVLMTEQSIATAPQYRKSTYSSAVGNNCVEVGLEVATTLNVCVRDTKDETRTTLRFTRDEWVAFIAGVKDGEFDLV
jgi:Domain of unknown function (DUF397)